MQKKTSVSKTKEHYVNNKEFLDELILCQQSGKISNALAEMFLKIAKSISQKRNYVHYSYRDDMIADAVLKCCFVYKSFNTDKYNNPFAFFTTVIINQFSNSITKEHKQQDIKDKLSLLSGLNPSSGYEDPEESPEEDY